MKPIIELWSSVELGAFGRGLLRHLDEAGFDTRHRFAVSEERYRDARDTLARGRVRWNSYVSYPLHLVCRLRNEAPPDALIVCTNTFYAPAVALWTAGWRVPVVNWVFDLYPDVLVEGKKIRGGGAPERLLGAVTRATLASASASVFLGERLRGHAEERYGACLRSRVIPVGADGQVFGEVEPALRALDDPLRVLYSGNLGRMHDTQAVAGLVANPGTSPWRITFRGHGAGFQELAPLAAGAGGRVTFGGSLPETEWAAAMKAAEVALVTMRPGAERLVMPSKTYSAMMAGQAIIAVCPAGSDLAETVQRDDAGWVVAPGDWRGLRAVLTSASADPQLVLRKRMNALRAARERYDQRVVAGAWSDLLSELIGTRTPFGGRRGRRKAPLSQGAFPRILTRQKVGGAAAPSKGWSESIKGYRALSSGPSAAGWFFK